jgi:hypothetical protein
MTGFNLELFFHSIAFFAPSRFKDLLLRFFWRKSIMSSKEKPLPKPPNTDFGRKKQFEQPEEQASLLADRMAAAMAEGKLDEFLKREMPDNEYARSLASMMMGMTGMMPPGGIPASSHAPANKEQPLSSVNAASGKIPSAEEVPEEVRKAVQGGDVKGLMDLLRREHQKRMPGEESPPEEATAPQPVDQPTIDKELIDALIQIAKDNSVTMDWIILRAIKAYVEEFRKTGKL